MEIRNLNKRVKRLEIIVAILCTLLVATFCTTIYGVMQVKAMSSKIPSYQEIKADIQTLNKIYKITEVKVPQAYDYTKEKAEKGYNYTKEKASELINYIKKKSEDTEKTKK